MTELFQFLKYFIDELKDGIDSGEYVLFVRFYSHGMIVQLGYGTRNVTMSVSKTRLEGCSLISDLASEICTVMIMELKADQLNLPLPTLMDFSTLPAR